MELVTFENALPTGFSSSPVISNVICYDLDTEFLEFAEKNNCVYTRY
ncbi:MAG: hypothetical protein LBQ59_01995 [Candidatus Peribacteria bacterium]|jgi:hypothetical protein|nr:hypothetical protein [Candidatus Peribacteria bacterium]